MRTAMNMVILKAREDGSLPVYADKGKGWRECVGRIMPSASQATLEASPGIQSWSSPRGKVATKMFDPYAVAKFNEQWSRNWAETYPLDDKAAIRRLS